MPSDRTDALTEIRRILEAGEAGEALRLIEARAEADAGASGAAGAESAGDAEAETGGNAAPEAPAAPPVDPELEILRARAEIALAEPDAALRSLTLAGAAGAEVAEVRALYADLRAGGGLLEADAHARFLTWLMEVAPEADLGMQLVRIQVSRGRPGKAGEAARIVLSLDPSRSVAYRYAYVAALRADQPEEAIEFIRGAIDNAPEDPRFPNLRSTMMGLEPAQARDLMAGLNARWPDSLSAGSKTGDLDAEDSGPALIARRAYLAAIEGETEEALALAVEARDEAEARGQALAAREEVMEDVIRALPGPAARRRPLLQDRGAEVTMSGPSLTGVTLLGLTNLAHRMNFDHEIIDAVAAATGAATILLRDYTYRLFIGGVAELGPDRASTIAALREKLAELKTERLIVVGTSAGAYSAVSYGRELGAAETHGLGTPTSIGRFLTGGDTRVKALIRKLSRSFPPEDLDLREVLPRIGGPATPIHLWFAANRATDRDHARDLAGLPGVELHPLEGQSEHQLLPRVIADGRLRDWLEP
ncbi:hypothetical protein GCM10011392_36780 [Wenxinia marina]|uniref:hypothetical protein n=1 Tax=Wenxinia marina TaxID=390641 RepID=UPI00039AB267|nr:hypothetical protein [Wenxinia marina]GGL78939.1 hypothetical protein GCM10011392_36780 [Wenxinia marina]